MAISKEDVLEAISSMTVMEVVDLVAAMEEKFGVSAAAAVSTAPAGGGEAVAVEEEQTEFNVVMSSFGTSKIKVIKAVRVITGLTLKQAKELVVGVPATIKEMVSKEEGEGIVKQLKEVGATAKLK